MALSASIFLVGCLNLANLQLARLHARAHELSVRMALGASSGRLIRQIVLEDALLVAGGLCVRVCAGPRGQRHSRSLGFQSQCSFHVRPASELASCGPRRRAYAAVAACASAFFRRSSSSVPALRRRQDRARKLQGFPKPQFSAFVPMCCLARRSVFRFCFPPCQDVSLRRWCTGKLWMWAWIVSMC